MKLEFVYKGVNIIYKKIFCSIYFFNLWYFYFLFIMDFSLFCFTCYFLGQLIWAQILIFFGPAYLYVLYFQFSSNINVVSNSFRDCAFKSESTLVESKIVLLSQKPADSTNIDKFVHILNEFSKNKKAKRI